jgi:hypothetical protein
MAKNEPAMKQEKIRHEWRFNEWFFVGMNHRSWGIYSPYFREQAGDHGYNGSLERSKDKQRKDETRKCSHMM